MKNFILLLICFVGIQINAQNLMRVTTHDGTQYEFSVNNIKDMDFHTLQLIDFIGEWITFNDISMSCYDIKDDGTLKYTSFNLTMGQFYEKDGTYSVKDNVLTLKYDGSTLVIPVVEATETKIVSTSGDTFYRVQSNVYSMTTNDNPISVGKEGDVVKYVDNCIVGTNNNMITALRDGRGYAIVEEEETGVMKAFGIDVLYVPESPIDWSNYFKKSKNEIIAELGEPAYKESFRYTNFNASIEYVTFTFNENNDEATKVNVSFYDETKRLHYCDSIEKHYFLYRESASSKTYYDTEDINTASVKVTVYDASLMCVIVYEDLKTTPASAIDWTTYFKQSAEQLVTEFGQCTDITNDDEYEDYSMVYYNVSDDIKSITFSFNKEFEKVTNIRVTFKNASSMQGYCDDIAAKYILYNDTGTRKTYYDTKTASTASIKVVIQSTYNYISYTDMTE